MKALRVRLGLSQDIQEDLGRLVQGLGALGLRGLHHEGLMDNEGEIHDESNLAKGYGGHFFTQ